HRALRRSEREQQRNQGSVPRFGGTGLMRKNIFLPISSSEQASVAIGHLMDQPSRLIQGASMPRQIALPRRSSSPGGCAPGRYLDPLLKRNSEEQWRHRIVPFRIPPSPASVEFQAAW